MSYSKAHIPKVRNKKSLNGIGDGQILTFGSCVVEVKIDDIKINIEFHVVPDEDIVFEAILGRTILKCVDLVVTEVEPY